MTDKRLRPFSSYCLTAFWGWCGLFGWPVWAAEPMSAQALPAGVQAALQRAQVPAQAMSAWVVRAGSAAAPRLSWRADVAQNPASVMKLVTSYAALELLGPDFVWETPVYLDASPSAGVLPGSVYIKGQGDPKLVHERLEQLLSRLRALGVQRIEGDIVLDRSAFALPAHDAARFDGEPWRPYNVAPDALLVNFHAVQISFTPDPGAGLARLDYVPPLDQVQLPASVPLAAKGACGDWRSKLQWTVDAQQSISFAGSYPSSCGVQQWHVALPEPQRFAARAIAGMWRAMGGELLGQVRDGQVPARLRPAFALRSPSLQETLIDINKYSNNVMTQQVFLTLAWKRQGRGTFEQGRKLVQAWWQKKLPQQRAPVLENGAGLSRHERISAQALGAMLQQAWASPVLAQLLATLPVAGVDGSLRQVQLSTAAGMGYLKTGTLRDVTALAGYVYDGAGQPWVLVSIINHPNAVAARPALHALVDWVGRLQAEGVAVAPAVAVSAVPGAAP